MSRRHLYELGTVVCHEESGEGLVYAGSIATVAFSWHDLVHGGEVCLQTSPGMSDQGTLVVLQPHEAVALGTMLIEAGQRAKQDRDKPLR